MTNLDIQAEGAIASITFRQDGKHVVGGTGLGSVRKWATADGREVGRVMLVGVEAGAVATSRDGVWIVGGTATGAVIVWKGPTHEKIAEVKGAHADWVLSVDISPDCKTFVTGSYDATVIVWELATGQKILGPIVHPSHVGTIRFSPTGERFATATWGDSSIRIFDSRSGELITRIPNAVISEHPNTLAWSDNGQRIFAPYEVSINQFNVATSSLISSWKVDPYIHVQHAGVSNSGQFIVCSIDPSRSVAFWDTLTHITICPSVRLTGRLRSVAISPDDTRIAFGQYDDKISLHNLRDILPHSYFVARNIPVLVSEKSRWNLHRQSRSTGVPLMHVNDLAFEPWVQGGLGNAESAFTQDIIRSSNRDHDALANRALIRACSKRFKEAIDDAEKSMRIQPSAIALIAKGKALIGDGRINDGYRACDLAIAQAPTSNDADFIRVIKSIIFCIVENSEDAISPVNDMMDTIDDKPMYYFIQAQLYFLFGNQQLARREYERAVQSFTHAQPPTQYLYSPYLTTISLVFGWNFEDLHFNAQRGLCEALCGADRPKEAVETLRRMMGCFSEETRPTQSTTEWITDFTQRCVLTLERTGDAAFSSDDYETATIHYALVIMLSHTCPKTVLAKWIKAKLTSGSPWKEVSRASVEFKILRFTIYQAVCDVLAEYGRLTEATECFQKMTNDAEWEATVNDEHHAWMLGFQHRCGDVAMESRQYDAAIDHYSAAVSHQPQKPDALVKRSKARAAKELWDDALEDTDEAMKLNPSSPWGYEAKYSVLCDAQRYDEAIEVFKAMLTMIEQSTDPAISGLRNNYVSPSEAMAAVDNVAFDILKNCPLILIDVTTGYLLTEHERMRIFKDGTGFKKLVTSMTRKLDREKIRNVVAKFLKYVMFSHVWSRPEEGKEPTFQDVKDVKSVWELPKTPQNEKLQNFCKKARNLEYRWVWSDTCCIDKLTNTILDRSLTSMYRWYAHSAVTFVLLLDVEYPSKLGDLSRSWWMTRAWTLQELLAPKVIVFYDRAWKPYLGETRANHKESPEITKELAEAIKIPSGNIVAFHPEDLTIREKLRLASNRNASIEEDIAYSLIGIFKSDIRPHYGEGGSDAVGHLLEEIVTRSGEVTVLEWTGKSSPYNSCLPASLSVYSQAPHRPEALGGEEMEASTQRLMEALGDRAVEFYDLVSNLPDASFSHRRLSLPCVIFHVSSLHVHELRHGSEKVYIAEAPGLGQFVQLTTTDDFPLQKPQKLCFVHPWIHRIRGVVNRRQEGLAPVPALPVSGPQVDEYTRAIQLVARIERPFSALLLLEQSDGKYKRVAAEREIIVEPKFASLKDIRVDTLQVL